MTELEEVAAKVDQLRSSFERKPDSRPWIKDILVPVAVVLLAVMGFIANEGANQRQKLEAKAAREQKYIEYFLANYADASPTKQAAAFALLKYVDPQVRKDLVSGLSANIDLSRDAWRVLVTLADVQPNFTAASSYRVEIYYGKEYDADAHKIEQQLKAAGFTGEIVVGEKLPAFWDKYGWGHGNEIRFDAAAESVAMKYLSHFVDAKNPWLKLREVQVDDPYRPRAIVVHLPPERKVGE